MTIFLYKRLIRNLAIGNNPVWVLPNICRLGQIRDTSFYRFWVIKGKLKRKNRRGKVPLPLPRLGLRNLWAISRNLWNSLQCFPKIFFLIRKWHWNIQYLDFSNVKRLPTVTILIRSFCCYSNAINSETFWNVKCFRCYCAI